MRLSNFVGQALAELFTAETVESVRGMSLRWRYFAKQARRLKSVRLQVNVSFVLQKGRNTLCCLRPALLRMESPCALGSGLCLITFSSAHLRQAKRNVPKASGT